MKTISTSLTRRRHSALISGLLVGVYGFAAPAHADIDTQQCSASVESTRTAAFSKDEQDLPYPKIGGLYQRPAAAGVSLTGDANQYVESASGALNGKYPLQRNGDHITLTGQGYFGVRWDIDSAGRGGTLPAENAPLFALSNGTLKRVALTDSYMPDYRLDGEPGLTGIGYAVGRPLITPGTSAGQGEIMPSLWRNEIFYLDGTVTLTQRQGEIDYKLGITPLTLAEVNAQLSTTRNHAGRNTLRSGISLDPYIGEDTPPASPGNLTATAIASSVVKLDWRDCADNARGFIVEYAEASGGSDRAYTSAESLGKGSESLELGTLQPDTTYFFRVKAYNQAGDSAYSNEVSVTTPASTPLSDNWKQQDIGKMGTAGTATEDNGVITLEAHNGDVWGAEDSIHVVYRELKGDGRITARLIDLRYSDPYAKAGVMMRNTLAANSGYVLAGYSASIGALSQWRSNTGNATGNSGHFPPSGNGSQPTWLRVTRDGNTFLAEASDDGKNWAILSKRTLVNFNDTLYVGLVLSSRNNSNGKVSFDNVSVER
ncbi:fibronectin type III domain-containing protein [Musicola keenii]|uniref:fibronectin type III domain-containing protein n=1 Tax=Musicola keenii TaxID=2884250 RepID=UPI001785C983|nr:DUF1349 domain-containing protein [Musicola keenii]